MVRRKPTPTDRKTLPQIYHRWLYQDGAAFWHTLSVAQKEQWESAARPFRITGFNYWMRTYLTTLPDLIAGYHLDCLSPTTVIDFSKNANNGVIYGALPAKGVIHNALRFDGVDDYTQAPDSPSLRLTDECTLLAWIHPISWPTPYGTIITKLQAWSQGYWFWVEPNAIRFDYVDTSLGIQSNPGWTPIPAGQWTHVAATKSGTLIKFYKNGDWVADFNPTVAAIKVGSRHCRLAHQDSHASWFHGYLDEVRVYNRPLDAIQIKRHSERSYPL